jgi:ribosomal protein S24E
LVPLRVIGADHNLVIIGTIKTVIGADHNLVLIGTIQTVIGAEHNLVIIGTIKTVTGADHSLGKKVKKEDMTEADKQTIRRRQLMQCHLTAVGMLMSRR